MSQTPDKTDLDKKRRQKLKKLQADLKYYAAHCLTIRDKRGQLVPLAFNKAQAYAHEMLEKQKLETGKVRALILKGRQQGMSTYVAARFFHQTTMVPGTTTFILSHQAKTTDPLFGMVKRYYDNVPQVLAPHLGTSNKNQMKFPDISSEYTVGTAGSEDIGRGFTVKLLHCSEAAWYDRTDYLETGLFQAVADLSGTEIIHESTANGMNNMFYRKAMDALKGEGEFQLIFIPWFWQEEYRAELPDDFQLSAEENELKDLYSLDDKQVYWRRLKIISLGNEWKFMQEYPMNAMEAFIVSGKSFLSQKLLMEARKRTIPLQKEAPKILGMDCARTNDRVTWVLRQGKKIIFAKKIDGKDLPEDPSPYLAELTAHLINDHNVDKSFIDYGQGYGVIDILRTTGYKHIVQGVNFGPPATDKVRFLNKRVEMAFGLREWLEEGFCDIPNDDEYFADLIIVPVEKRSPSQKFILVPKDQIKSEYGISTDYFDATILTFAFPVQHTLKHNSRPRKAEEMPNKVQRKSELNTINRITNSQKSRNKTLKIDADFNIF